MKAAAFWKRVTMDRTDFLERVLNVLHEGGVRYCVIGGLAVNAYAEPVVTLDVDVVVAVQQRPELVEALSRDFRVEHHPHSINVAAAGSDLRLQIQTDPRYDDFVERASTQPVLGLMLPVASLPDVLQGKIWAVQDPSRRSSKRQKDLADIARLLEVEPALRSLVPAEVRAALL